MFFARQKQEELAPVRKSAWEELLETLNQLNRSVKEPGWYDQDKRDIYALKDRIIAKALLENPAELEIELYRIPYIVYSQETKDRAGTMMRSEGNRYPFDVYLSLVKLSPQDVEDVSRATVEIDITCSGRQFVFHCPAGVVERTGIQVATLPPKEWVAPSDFHHAQYLQSRERIQSLLATMD